MMQWPALLLKYVECDQLKKATIVILETIEFTGKLKRGISLIVCNQNLFTWPPSFKMAANFKFSYCKAPV